MRPSLPLVVPKVSVLQELPLLSLVVPKESVLNVWPLLQRVVPNGSVLQVTSANADIDTKSIDTAKIIDLIFILIQLFLAGDCSQKKTPQL